MAWTSAHFAVGMATGGAATLAASLIFPRAWKWATPAMTLGGIWAIVPDLPRIWREDFPSLPLSSLLGRRELETWLHHYGDVFCLHRMMDAQPHEYALHGLAAILLLYNLAYVPWVFAGRRHVIGRQAMTNNTHARPGSQPIYPSEGPTAPENEHDHRHHHHATDDARRPADSAA